MAPTIRLYAFDKDHDVSRDDADEASLVIGCKGRACELRDSYTLREGLSMNISELLGL
ncbi:MAG: hypothetical protein OXD43_07025 [Bacteroidetes bacterium]|nr:hypothetical protein [Bacteroidota bacterium]